MEKKLTHLDEEGAASMVDVSDKPISRREAVASAFICLQADNDILLLRQQVSRFMRCDGGWSLGIYREDTSGLSFFG